MALSDLVVRQAKATGKAYTLPDLDGLSLAVTAAGGRTWHFRYYWAGKQKRMAVPPFMAKMSLANTSGATASSRRTVSA